MGVLFIPNVATKYTILHPFIVDVLIKAIFTRYYRTPVSSVEGSLFTTSSTLALEYLCFIDRRQYHNRVTRVIYANINWGRKFEDKDASLEKVGEQNIPISRVVLKSFCLWKDYFISDAIKAN